MSPHTADAAGARAAPQWPRISLFWRTFLLLALLIGVSLGTTLGIAGLLDRAPPEQRLAWEIASVVNLTRSALVSAEPDRRLDLVEQLAHEEEVRVLPKEPEDRIDDDATGPRLRALQPRLRQLLGAGTHVAGRVNGIDGVWISFEIDGDDYWLILPRARVERQFGPGYARSEALNHALAGIPEEQIRYHICWGSWHGPHAEDVPIKDIIDLLLEVNAGAYVIEAANVRHQHEYHVWEDVKLPEGKVLDRQALFEQAGLPLKNAPVAPPPPAPFSPPEAA